MNRSNRSVGGAVAGFFIILAMIYAVMMLDRASRVVQIVATSSSVELHLRISVVRARRGNRAWHGQEDR